MCQTLQLSNKIRNIAAKFGTSNLLVKLSEGDMVATEAKYHLRCLTELYNQYRDFKRKTQLNNEESNFIEGICFTTIIWFIKFSFSNF